MPAPSPFENPPERSITIEVFGRSAVVVLRGDLDRQEDDDLAEAVAYAVRCGHHRLVLDFTTTTFLDCGSYRGILRGLGGLEKITSAAVVIAGAGAAVERMLYVLEADLLFTLFPARGTALAALRDPSRPPNDGWRTIPPPRLVPPRERPVEHDVAVEHEIVAEHEHVADHEIVAEHEHVDV